MKRFIFAIALVAVVAIAASPTTGQIAHENHYLVYNLEVPLDFPADLLFRDQWGSWEGSQHLVLEKWANPLFHKNGEEVIFDPLIHHTWWILISYTGFLLFRETMWKIREVQHPFSTRPG